jgi:hypothetical protein
MKFDYTYRREKILLQALALIVSGAWLIVFAVINL